MSSLKIEPEVFALFPDLRLGVIRCRSIQNIGFVGIREHLLQGSQEKARNALDKDSLLEHPAIKAWRQAYKTMGIPKGNRCSVENLVRRVLNGNAIPMINPLVDLYNAVSLEYLIPCGGSDISSICGDVRLGASGGGESFIPLGSQENQPPEQGEIIYADAAGVLCRCLNWREGERTCLKDETTDAFLIMESLEPDGHNRMGRAMGALKSLIENMLHGRAETFILNSDNPEMKDFVIELE